ncbi:MAG: hypothetical protein EZS28_025110 [Streblomastix strix]|uniref:Uncharacterized protein n=1 Tax=Streblomastix strix TaxID=222440 RepID=A0A5J4VA13_9EUKA|nr:MAG: hypothetical protein EZS28_025110 [Streblomastix strix]
MSVDFNFKVEDARRNAVQHFFSSDPLQNLRIAVAVRKIPIDTKTDILLEQAISRKAPFGGLDAGTDEYFTAIFGWQHKFFSPEEVKYYTQNSREVEQIGNELDLSYLRRIQQLQEESEGSYQGNTIYTYTSQDFLLPSCIKCRKLSTSAGETTPLTEGIFAMQEGDASPAIHNRTPLEMQMHLMVAVYRPGLRRNIEQQEDGLQNLRGNRNDQQGGRLGEIGEQIGEELLCTLTMSENGRLDIRPPLLNVGSNDAPVDQRRLFAIESDQGVGPYKFLSKLGNCTFEYTIEDVSALRRAEERELEAAMYRRVYDRQNRLRNLTIAQQPFIQPSVT